MKQYNFPQRQQGAALITALIILLVITVLGVAGMSDSTQQETMVGNTMLRQVAFQATETTLRDGESTVEDLPATEPTKGSPIGTTDFSVTDFFMAQRIYNDQGTLVNDLRTDAENDPACSNDATSINIRCLGDETGFSAFPNAAEAWPTQPRYVKEYLTDSRQTGSDSLDLTSDNATYYYRISSWGTDPSQTAEVVLQTTYARRFDIN